MGAPINYQQDGAIARVTLDRPEKRNSINHEIISELRAIATSVETDESIRMVTIQGAGDDFCAGADLAMFADAVESGDREQVSEYVDEIHAAFDAVEAMPVPTLGVLDGYVLAGGLELALVCDLLVASTEAVIGDQHANYGLVAGGGATQRLPRQIPQRYANDLLLTGRHISGATAAEWGLVNRAVPPENLDDARVEYEELLAEKSRTAATLTKELIQRGTRTDKAAGLDLERRAVAAHDFTEDALEGFRAFKEGRDPEF